MSALWFVQWQFIQFNIWSVGLFPRSAVSSFYFQDQQTKMGEIANHHRWTPDVSHLKQDYNIQSCYIFMLLTTSSGSRTHPT